MGIFRSEGLKHLSFYLLIVFFIASVQMQSSYAATLDSCTYPGGTTGDTVGGEQFYVPHFNGISLKQATLQLSSRTAGSFTFSLTAHSGTFDGPVLGTANATVSLTDVDTSFVPAVFDFGSVPISQGSTVAFVINKTGGPGGFQFFRTPPTFAGDPSCQVIETEDATPPLSTFRRQGIDVVITGDLPSAVSSVPTMNEWGMLIFVVLSGLGSILFLRRYKIGQTK